MGDEGCLAIVSLITTAYLVIPLAPEENGNRLSKKPLNILEQQIQRLPELGRANASYFVVLNEEKLSSYDELGINTGKLLC